MITARRTIPTRPAKGFTLLEIMVVVAIIAVLLSIGVAAGLRMKQSNKLNSTRLLLSKLQAVQTQYELLTKQKVNHSKVIKKPFLWEGNGAVEAISTLWSFYPQKSSETDPPTAVKLDKEVGDGDPIPGVTDIRNDDPWEDQEEVREENKYGAYRHSGIERWVWAMSQIPAMRDMLADLDEDYLQDTDGDGFLEVLDGWGRPVIYAAYVYHAPKDDDIVEMDQFLRQVGGPFPKPADKNAGNSPVSAPAKWRPFFASAGPDEYWGNINENFTIPVDRDVNKNDVDDRTEDNLFSFDLEGGHQ